MVTATVEHRKVRMIENGKMVTGTEIVLHDLWWGKFSECEISVAPAATPGLAILWAYNGRQGKAVNIHTDAASLRLFAGELVELAEHLEESTGQ